MKIDFTKLQIRLSLDKSTEPIERDVAKIIGDAVFVNSTGIEAKRLAERIFDSTEQVELTENEVAQVVACMESAHIINPLIEAVKTACYENHD